MGTQYNHYVLFGVNLDPKEVDRKIESALGKDAHNILEMYEDNEYSGKVTEHHGLTVIEDGMSGEYLLIGKVLARSRVDEPLDDLIEVGKAQLDSLIEPIAVALTTKLPILFPSVEDIKLRLYVVSHAH